MRFIREETKAPENSHGTKRKVYLHQLRPREELVHELLLLRDPFFLQLQLLRLLLHLRLELDERVAQGRRRAA